MYNRPKQGSIVVSVFPYKPHRESGQIHEHQESDDKRNGACRWMVESHRVFGLERIERVCRDLVDFEGLA